MKRLQDIAARINARSARERLLVFVTALAVVLFCVYSLVLSPMLAEQAQLESSIKRQRADITDLDRQIAARIENYEHDPDAPARERLAALHQEIGHLGQQLQAIERGLVPPERMTPLLDAMLRRHGRLSLVSLRTLPVVPMATPHVDPYALAAPEQPAMGQAAVTDGRTLVDKVTAPNGSGAGQDTSAQAPALLFRHGVQITLRGSYLDMVDYMTALEVLPTRMFWGQAQLEVEQYPVARLTLTLHTLSLDKQWMKL